jgi:hypothetical protein
MLLARLFSEGPLAHRRPDSFQAETGDKDFVVGELRIDSLRRGRLGL